MAEDGPNWEGLLKWSLAHTDGTRPTRNLRYPLINQRFLRNICISGAGLFNFNEMGVD